MLPPIVYIPYDAKDEKLYEFVRSRMDRIVTEYDEKKTFRESLIYAQLIEMFVTLGRVVMEGLYEKNEIVSDGQATKHKEYMETVMGACNYINQHYQENITLEEVASVSGFSKFHFTRIFKQCMDMTFYEYLNERRITKAEELLYTTVLSVTDIAMQSGFSSISAFNRTFKTMKGCSPSEYRNKLFVSKE